MRSLYEWDFEKGVVLQLIEDKERSGKSSVTIMTHKIDELKKTLDKKDIKVEFQTDSEIAKTITIFDPEDNRITFAENLQGR